MRATLQTKRVFLSDVEVGDVVSNGSRVFQVAEVIGKNDDEDGFPTTIVLVDKNKNTRLLALEGKRYTVVQVYVRVPVPEEAPEPKPETTPISKTRSKSTQLKVLT